MLVLTDLYAAKAILTFDTRRRRREARLLDPVGAQIEHHAEFNFRSFDCTRELFVFNSQADRRDIESQSECRKSAEGGLLMHTDLVLQLKAKGFVGVACYCTLLT